MDYKYIEQLLERYWNCETSVEEEQILRTFFSQDNVPDGLKMYRDLFVYQQLQSDSNQLSSDFDERVCRIAESTKQQEKTVKARHFRLSDRLRPLYHAAASIAVILLAGTGAQYILNRPQSPSEWDYNAETYKDSYDNPQEAYETLGDGIRELKDVLNMRDNGTAADTVHLSGKYQEAEHP